MDFNLSGDQQELAALAARILADCATDQPPAVTEASADRVDRLAWKRLADAGLLGVLIPEQYGGLGLGLVEACLILEQQGRTLVPIPLWPTLVLAAAPIAEFGTDQQRRRWLPGIAAGDVIATGALAEPGANDALAPGVTAAQHDGDWTITGTKPAVPAGLIADVVLVPAQTTAGVRVFLLDPTASRVSRTAAETTNHEIHAHFEFDAAPAELLGGAGALSWLHDRAQVGLAALQLGVAEEALQRAAAYLATRHQFGVPLGSLQGPQLRAADAYIDVQVMRCTLWQAAWLLAESRPAECEVRSAKWWAAEAGQRVVHAVQHLHGGIGADVDYPIHRYFLWGKQIENQLGGASSQLAALGALLVDRHRDGKGKVERG